MVPFSQKLPGSSINLLALTLTCQIPTIKLSNIITNQDSETFVSLVKQQTLWFERKKALLGNLIHKTDKSSAIENRAQGSPN